MVHSCRFTKGPSLRRLSGKIRKIQDLTKRREHESHAPFPTAEIFDLSWPFRYRFKTEEERKFLIVRIRNYVYRQRRGSFKLPSRFKSLVAEVSSMTKSHIREVLYKVKPDIAAECSALRATFDYANRVLTRCVWRFSGSLSEDCARRVDCHRLAKRDWPRNARSLWPSSPSVTELIAMARSGKTPDGPMWKPPKIALHNLRVQDLSTDSYLASRVVSNNVVGIRSTVPIPRKFLHWFRYRDGFLILTVRSSIPIGLVRLLLSEWIRNPFNLWLKVNCRLKYYLRLTETPPERREAHFVPTPVASLGAGSVERSRGKISQYKTVKNRLVLRTTSDEPVKNRIRRTQLAKLT
jgi:hypothetical protein